MLVLFCCVQVVVCVMLNLFVVIGKGVVVLYGVDGDIVVCDVVEVMMILFGLVEWIVEEVQFDVVIVFVGCGFVFVFCFVDVLVKVGVVFGFFIDQVLWFVFVMLEGLFLMVVLVDVLLVVLVDCVVSFGGLICEGLNVLDYDDVLVWLLMEMLMVFVWCNGEMVVVVWWE